MFINRLAILGVGLIGGSLARALKQKNVCQSIVGFGRNEINLKQAVELGVIDEYEMDVSIAIQDADVMILATPISTTEPLLIRMRDSIKEGAVITDVGSAKGRVVDAAQSALSESQFQNFVPAHPIAGTEKSGVGASFAQLFEEHLVILTPMAETNSEAVDIVSQMWGYAGAKVTSMDISYHDEILAATSHLPHMLAYALVDCLAGMQERDEIFKFAAGGFSDFTRIASSNPQMWQDICISNRDNLLEILDRFDNHLDSIREAIRRGDSSGLFDIFVRAKNARDEFSVNQGNNLPKNVIE